MQFDRIPKSILIGLLFIISFTIYANSLWGDFLVDDIRTIQKEERIHDLKTYFSKHFSVHHNVFNEVIRALIWDFSPDNPFYFHLFNVLTNSLCAILLFILCEILFHKTSLSFLSAIIFALHPIHTEAVSWISGGSYALSGLFFMFSFTFYVKSYRSFLNISLAALAFIICFFVGNSVVVLPVLFILYDLLFREKKSEDKSIIKFRLILLSFILLLSSLVMLHFFINQNRFMHMIFYYRGYSYLIVAAKAFLYYLKILYLPYQRGLYHPFAFNTTKIQELSPALFFSIAIFIGLIISFFKCRRKIAPVSFGIIWFFITYLPYSNIIPVANIISERYLYLPSVGFSIAIAALFLKAWEFINQQKYYRNFFRKIAVIALSFFLTSYAILTFKRNYEYHNIITYWQTNINNFPDGYTVYNNLAATYYKMGDIKNAIAYCIVNLMVNPNQPHVWYNLGKVYEEIKDIKQAQSCYEEVLKLDKNYFPAYEALNKIKEKYHDIYDK
ncbi:MAG: tetratricopeptide repeat protein [Candidatus Omnitrophica bacterium]|jgi:tetratricopeptide (TPR) repeat protein|nr:tetratricopeptide repeat protein [Candidatus Omnitrophota bacterium]